MGLASGRGVAPRPDLFGAGRFFGTKPRGAGAAANVNSGDCFVAALLAMTATAWMGGKTKGPSGWDVSPRPPRPPPPRGSFSVIARRRQTPWRSPLLLSSRGAVRRRGALSCFFPAFSGWPEQSHCPGAKRKRSRGGAAWRGDGFREKSGKQIREIASSLALLAMTAIAADLEREGQGSAWAEQRRGGIYPPPRFWLGWVKRLLQAEGLFRAHLLTAEAGDAALRVHPGQVVHQLQGPHRALLHAGAAAGAAGGVGLGPLSDAGFE